jgi:hypothetical protein
MIRGRSARGAAAIETAAFLMILIPIMAGLCGLFGVAFGYGIHVYQQTRVQHAAELGSRQFRYGLESSEWLGSPVRSFFPSSNALPMNRVNEDSVTKAIRADLNAMGLHGDSADIKFEVTPLDVSNEPPAASTAGSPVSYYNEQFRFAKITISFRDLPNIPIYYYFYPTHSSITESASSLIGNMAAPVVASMDFINAQEIIIPGYGNSGAPIGGPPAGGIKKDHSRFTWNGTIRSQMTPEDYWTTSWGE